MKKSLFGSIVALALPLAAFAGNAWQTTNWSGEVKTDVGYKSKAPEKAKLTVTKKSATEMEADFWGIKETWTFTNDTYVWNDGATKVTLKKVPLKDAAAKIKGLDTLAGVAGAKESDVAVYSQPKCEKLTDKGSCTFADDAVWGFSTIDGKNNFFVAYNLPENKGQRFLSIVGQK